jgi:flagellar hook protein FlgE
MMRSLWSGISGLAAHQVAMDVEGNNIANVNTIGFKSSRTSFQDLLSQTASSGTGPQGKLGGRNAQQIGSGVQVATIERLFTQGPNQNTDKQTDLSLQGDGFFVVSDDGGKSTNFTRAGNFNFDANGNYVMPSGLIVQGWTADENHEIDNTKPTGNITIDPSLTTPAKSSSEVSIDANLNSGLTVKNKTSAAATVSVNDDLSKVYNQSGQEILLKDGIDTLTLTLSRTFDLAGTATNSTSTHTFTYGLGKTTTDGYFTSVKDLIDEINAKIKDSTGINDNLVLLDGDGKISSAGHIKAVIDSTTTNDVLQNVFEAATSGKFQTEALKSVRNGFIGADSVGEMFNEDGDAFNLKVGQGIKVNVEKLGETRNFIYRDNSTTNEFDFLTNNFQEPTDITTVTKEQGMHFLIDSAGNDAAMNSGQQITMNFNTELTGLTSKTYTYDTNFRTINDLMNAVSLDLAGAGHSELELKFDDVTGVITDTIGILTSAVIKDSTGAEITPSSSTPAIDSSATAVIDSSTTAVIDSTTGVAVVDSTGTAVLDSTGAATFVAPNTQILDSTGAATFTPVNTSPIIDSTSGVAVVDSTGANVLDSTGAATFVAPNTQILDSTGAAILDSTGAATFIASLSSVFNATNGVPVVDSTGTIALDASGNATFVEPNTQILDSTGAAVLDSTGAATFGLSSLTTNTEPSIAAIIGEVKDTPLQNLSQLFSSLGGAGTSTGLMRKNDTYYFTDTQDLVNLYQDAIDDAADPLNSNIKHEANVSLSDEGRLLVKNTGSTSFSIATSGYPDELNSNQLFRSAMTTLSGQIGANSTSFSERMFAATHSTSVDVFDSAGSRHTLTFNFRKESTSQENASPTVWNWYVEAPNPSTFEHPASGKISFNLDGSLQSFTPPAVTLNPNTGSTSGQIIQLNFGEFNGFNGLTSFAQESATNSRGANGYSGGVLKEVTVDQTGKLIGNFTNDQTFVLGQVAVAKFPNNEGLEAAGGNLFSRAPNSGVETIGTAGAGGRGSIAPSSLEMSNVDLSDALTNLIVVQRGFQANSKTITTSDQMLNTLLQLKQ